MADVIPFSGTRYDPAAAGEIGELIAPPYDVIDGTLRDALFHSSEFNIARIIKADRGDPDAPYAAAARLWESWSAHGVVRCDEDPAIYVYEQHFEIHERKFSRTGMIALVKLAAFGNGVLPHETTLSGPRADRLDLLRAMKTHFGLVFALYPDAENQVDSLLEQGKTKRPLVQAPSRDNELHRLWAVTDPAIIGRIQDLMREKDLLIADGHHRYETALAFRDENPAWEAARYRMMALVNTANVGLVVLPTHRLIKNLPEFDPPAFLARLRRYFTIRSYPGASRAVCSAVLDAIRIHQDEGRHAVGLCLGDGKHYVLRLRTQDAMAEVENHSEAWRRLDVAILHHLILEVTLGITPEQIQQQVHVEYIQDLPHTILEAADRVHSGQAQALFLLNPTRIEDVMTVAQNGERMPQKSTFFYPKVYTGLIFNRLES